MVNVLKLTSAFIRYKYHYLQEIKV